MKVNKIYQVFKLFFKIAGQDQKIDSYFRLQNFASTLSRLHFNSNGYYEGDKRAFFKNQLEEIELETHAYCNRKCEFCPNVSIDRTDKEQILPEKVFNRIVDELSEIDFKGTLKFHRFNEPLALNLIFDRINYARKRLPNAILGLHSNGDYTRFDVLRKCEQLGLNFLYISLYIDYNSPTSQFRSAAQKYCKEYLKKRNLRSRPIAMEDDNLARYRIPMEKMRVVLFVPDIKDHGDDRGGFLKNLTGKEIRISPCISPFRRMFIDWTGDVLPCCNLRSDIESHKSYILGNVKNSSLQDIFFSDVANKVRRILADFSEKQGPCRHCRFDLFLSSNRAKKLMGQTIRKII